MVVSSYSSLPYWDGWTQIEIAAGGGNPLSPAWLWQQHNEHRLVIPKLFLAADLRLFQARQVFLLASIFVIQLLHLTLLSWSMWVLGGWRGALWRTGTGLAAFCLLCPSQRENLIWGFQVCFVLPQLFATLSFMALLLYWMESRQQPDKRPSSKYLVVSVLAALGATYSLASGVLLWPLLVVAALYLRLRIAAVLSLAVTGILSTALYLYGYVRPEIHASPITSLATPGPLLKYWAVYFVSSWIHRDIHTSRTHRTCWIGDCDRIAFSCTILRSCVSPFCDSTCAHNGILPGNCPDYSSGEDEFRLRASVLLRATRQWPFSSGVAWDCCCWDPRSLHVRECAITSWAHSSACW